jgi:hypothetical protein
MGMLFFDRLEFGRELGGDFLLFSREFGRYPANARRFRRQDKNRKWVKESHCGLRPNSSKNSLSRAVLLRLTTPVIAV